MPIWLRNFTFKSINKWYEDQAEAQEKAERESKGIQEANASNMVARPGVLVLLQTIL